MHYLFERIASAGEPCTGAPGDALREAVRCQIQRVFASHLGSGAAALELMGFGSAPLPGTPGTSSRYLAEMARLVGSHEPRLEDVTVTFASHAGAPLCGHVTIQGRLACDDEADTLRFDFRHRA